MLVDKQEFDELVGIYAESEQEFYDLKIAADETEALHPGIIEINKIYLLKRVDGLISVLKSIKKIKAAN